MVAKITENTLIPLSFIAVIVAAVIYITSVGNTANQALAQSSKCEADISAIQQTSLNYLITIEQRLSNIEGYLGTKKH